ncbi:hypothetical protein D477_008133 [Arthrobacter crystallopoietes BAB-32]|uniref:Uncharacterized protein n=1 Tax=Arthrobacter crystallopoietes BAB-32 TaxID=1246476 RepID=N1UWF7_9MICC|nr:hypothetical protein [Arthrobacter crystallopoietes]EMY34721.1 hypothetical protein D477_008133 [Arthrobacter crystallopoietes BAB-32]
MLRTRQRVGHDILLARHGNTISSMRLDRRTNSVVAVLDNGTVDRAPNLISPDLPQPVGPSGLTADDRKLLGLVTGAFAGLGAVMVGGVLAMAHFGQELGLTEAAAYFPAY